MRYTYNGQTVEVNPEGPIIDIVDTLFDLGMPSSMAEDRALQIVERHG